MKDESQSGMGTGMVVGILVVVVVLVALVVVGMGEIDRVTTPVTKPNGQSTGPSMDETDAPIGGEGGNATQEINVPDPNIDIPDEVDVNVNQGQE